MCSPFYYNKLARKAWQRLLWREKESMNIVFENNRAENEGRNAAASAAYSNTNKAIFFPPFTSAALISSRMVTTVPISVLPG